MTLISKNVYIDNLVDKVNEYVNTHYSKIEVKLVYVKSNTYIDFNKENNKKDLKLEVGYHAKISKDKSNFSKGCIPNWYKGCLWLKRLKTLCDGHILLTIFMVRKFLECFTKKDCKKQIKRSLKLKK